MKTKLLLVVSERMDTNERKGRYEDKLIRMSQKARDFLGLSDDKVVELWPSGSTRKKIARSKTLAIFKAYSSDIKKLRYEGMPKEDMVRVGFVTSRTFDYICGQEQPEDIWLADTIEETIIGGDPEFLLTITDNRAQYAGYISGFFGDGIDQLDSDGPLAELRPDPEVKVENFVNNIQKLLTTHRKVEKISNYNWVGGCYYNMINADTKKQKDWVIGGHIHIGTPLKIADKMLQDQQFRKNTHAIIQKILDEYVTIPMMKVEGVKDSCKRRGYYGKYGEKRLKGVNKERLEFRSLSGHWLTHPKLANAVLGTVKAVSHAIFRNIEEDESAIVTKNNLLDENIFNNSNDLVWGNIELVSKYGATRTNTEMRKILHEGQINFSKSFVNKIKKNLRGLNTYSDYKDHIDTFCEVISQPDEKLFKQEKDLKKTWIENQDFII